MGSTPDQPKIDTQSLADSLATFEHRKRYPTITPEVLASIPDEDVEQALIDHVIDVKINDRFDDELEIVRGLSRGYRMLYSTWRLEAEVNNGGFNQFFWNSSGRYAADALDGCRLVGATEHAALMEQAIAIHEKEQPMRRTYEEEGTLEAFSESYETTELNALDEPFYARSLSPLRVRYIRTHPDEFTSP